jgi:hypothetical protein
VGRLRELGRRIGRAIDRIDSKVDKPARQHGTFTQGSEQIVDAEMPEEMGKATSNRRAGYGRNI